MSCISINCQPILKFKVGCIIHNTARLFVNKTNSRFMVFLLGPLHVYVRKFQRKELYKRRLKTRKTRDTCTVRRRGG